MSGRDASLLDLLSRARSEFTADTVAVLLLDPAGVYLDTYAAVGIELTVRERVRVPMGKGFAGRIAKERAPLVIEEVNDNNVVNPVLRRHGVRSLLGVPLLYADDLIGVLHVGSLTPRRFTRVEVERLQEFGGHVSRAVQDQIALEERSATVALQRSLLPSKLPDVPGLDLSARYLHATGDLGGDWYDVLALPEGRVGLVMGDVAGHGFPAAVIMGRLRSALRAYALEYADPADVLRRLDRKIQHFEPGVFATVLYAVAEPPYCMVQVSSAGHPAPLLLHADRPSELTSVPPDLPMGVATDVPRRTSTVARAGRHRAGAVHRRAGRAPTAGGLPRPAAAAARRPTGPRRRRGLHPGRRRDVPRQSGRGRHRGPGRAPPASGQVPATGGTKRARTELGSIRVLGRSQREARRSPDDDRARSRHPGRVDR